MWMVKALFLWCYENGGPKKVNNTNDIGNKVECFENFLRKMCFWMQLEEWMRSPQQDFILCIVKLFVQSSYTYESSNEWTKCF